MHHRFGMNVPDALKMVPFNAQPHRRISRVVQSGVSPTDGPAAGALDLASLIEVELAQMHDG
jgi:hypothetical protein